MHADKHPPGVLDDGSAHALKVGILAHLNDLGVCRFAQRQILLENSQRGAVAAKCAIAWFRLVALRIAMGADAMATVRAFRLLSEGDLGHLPHSSVQALNLGPFLGRHFPGDRLRR